MKFKKLRSSFLFLAFGGLVLSGCAVLPNEAEEGPALDPLPNNEQEKFINKIVETKYLDADLDILVAYKGPDMETPDNYHVTGNALLDIENLENVGADVELTLDMNNTPSEEIPLINVDFVYKESTVYLDVNGRSVKLETDDFSELLELLLGDGGDSEPTPASDQTNITNSGIKEIISNIANMTVTNEGDHYKYVAQTTGDQPELVLTSDLDYNVTSLAIAGIKYQDFTIDVNVEMEVKSSIDTPIVSPETSGHPYINLTNYFGTLRKLRAILDDEEFGMDYRLALTHYEPKTPETKVYLGDTSGHLDMNLDTSAVDLNGRIYISDIRTDDHRAYATNYHAQYINKSIYLDYALTDNSHYKLTFSNQGLQDMWELMGDEEVFGINIFDLIFGASDKEYPIIDILTDSTYRYLAKYGSINLGLDYIEVDVNNELFGGLGHGSIKINLNEDKSIYNVSITSLDINSYIVDGVLTFEDYQEITPVTPSEFSSLDGLDALIRSGASYYRSNKFNLGVKLDITDTVASKTFSILDEGEKRSTAQINIHQKDALNPDTKTGYDGDAHLYVNDFDGNNHEIRLNANPKDGEENVYAYYKYKDHTADPGDEPIALKLRASRDSISALFDQLMGYNEDEEGEGSIDLFKMIEPYIVGATKDTLHRVLKEGDYFAVLRDETIKSIVMDDNVYTVVLAHEAFGGTTTGFTQDITFNIAMKTVIEEEEEKDIIDWFDISTKYDKYSFYAKVTLKDNNADIPELSDKTDYIPIDSLTDIFLNQKVSLDVNASVGKVINNTVEPYIDVRGATASDPCKIDAEIKEKSKETDDLWDRLYARIEGSVKTSGGEEWTPFILGYDDNLSIKFGDDAKVTVTRSNVRDIIDRAKTVLPETHVVPEVPKDEETNEPLDKEVEANVNMFLQVMEMLSEGNYGEFLSKIKTTSLEPGLTSTDPNNLVITVDNSLFSTVPNDDTTATISISFYNDGVNAGIDKITLDDFRYSNYSLTGYVQLKSRTREKVDVDGYNEIYNIVDALLGSATPKDIVLSGQIKMNAKAVGFDAMYREFTYGAFVHKEADVNGNENVYGEFTFNDVPFLYVGPAQWAAFYKVSDDKDEWDDGNRTFKVYFASVVEYDGNGHTRLDSEGEPIRTSTIGLYAEYYNGSTQKIKEKVINSDDFMADMTYYLLNYGLGIKAIDRSYSSSNADAFNQEYGEHKFSDNPNEGFINFHNYNIDNNYTPNLSTLLKSYEYDANGKNYTSSIYDAMSCNTSNQAWVVTIDGGNLLNNNQIKNVELFTHTDTNGNTTYLKKVILTTKVSVSVATLSVGLTVDYNYAAKPTTTQVAEVKQYINTHAIGYRRYKSGSNDYIHNPNAA